MLLIKVKSKNTFQCPLWQMVSFKLVAVMRISLAILHEIRRLISLTDTRLNCIHLLYSYPKSFHIFLCNVQINFNICSFSLGLLSIYQVSVVGLRERGTGMNTYKLGLHIVSRNFSNWNSKKLRILLFGAMKCAWYVLSVW